MYVYNVLTLQTPPKRVCCNVCTYTNTNKHRLKTRSLRRFYFEFQIATFHKMMAGVKPRQNLIYILFRQLLTPTCNVVWLILNQY